MSDDEQTLIIQAQRGNARAFETLVHRYDKQVLAIALSYTGDEDDARDIYQDVFIRVFRALSGFRFESQFSTWLYRIATNVCLTYRKRSATRSFVSIEDEWQDDEDGTQKMILYDERTPDEPVINREIAAHIHKAIDELSPQQRMVFSLRHFEGFKLREIASMLDCAEGTVKKYLFTATERLRGRLREVYPGG